MEKREGYRRGGGKPERKDSFQVIKLTKNALRLLGKS